MGNKSKISTIDDDLEISDTGNQKPLDSDIGEKVYNQISSFLIKVEEWKKLFEAGIGEENYLKTEVSKVDVEIFIMKKLDDYKLYEKKKLSVEEHNFNMKELMNIRDELIKDCKIRSGKLELKKSDVKFKKNALYELSKLFKNMLDGAFLEEGEKTSLPPNAIELVYLGLSDPNGFGGEFRSTVDDGIMMTLGSKEPQNIVKEVEYNPTISKLPTYEETENMMKDVEILDCGDEEMMKSENEINIQVPYVSTDSNDFGDIGIWEEEENEIIKQEKNSEGEDSEKKDLSEEDSENVEGSKENFEIKNALHDNDRMRILNDDSISLSSMELNGCNILSGLITPKSIKGENNYVVFDFPGKVEDEEKGEKESLNNQVKKQASQDLDEEMWKESEKTTEGEKEGLKFNKQVSEDREEQWKESEETEGELLEESDENQTEKVNIGENMLLSLIDADLVKLSRNDRSNEKSEDDSDDRETSSKVENAQKSDEISEIVFENFETTSKFSTDNEEELEFDEKENCSANKNESEIIETETETETLMEHVQEFEAVEDKIEYIEIDPEMTEIEIKVKKIFSFSIDENFRNGVECSYIYKSKENKIYDESVIGYFYEKEIMRIIKAENNLRKIEKYKNSRKIRIFVGEEVCLYFKFFDHERNIVDIKNITDEERKFEYQLKGERKQDYQLTENEATLKLDAPSVVDIYHGKKHLKIRVHGIPKKYENEIDANLVYNRIKAELYVPKDPRKRSSCDTLGIHICGNVKAALDFKDLLSKQLKKYFGDIPFYVYVEPEKLRNFEDYSFLRKDNGKLFDCHIRINSDSLAPMPDENKKEMEYLVEKSRLKTALYLHFVGGLQFEDYFRKFGERKIRDIETWKNFKSGYCFGTAFEKRNDFLFFYHKGKICISDPTIKKGDDLYFEKYRKNMDELCFGLQKMWNERGVFGTGKMQSRIHPITPLTSSCYLSEFDSDNLFKEFPEKSDYVDIDESKTKIFIEVRKILSFSDNSELKNGIECVYADEDKAMKKNIMKLYETEIFNISQAVKHPQKMKSYMCDGKCRLFIGEEVIISLQFFDLNGSVVDFEKVDIKYRMFYIRLGSSRTKVDMAQNPVSFTVDQAGIYGISRNVDQSPLILRVYSVPKYYRKEKNVQDMYLKMEASDKLYDDECVGIHICGNISTVSDFPRLLSEKLKKHFRNVYIDVEKENDEYENYRLRRKDNNELFDCHIRINSDSLAPMPDENKREMEYLLRNSRLKSALYCHGVCSMQFNQYMRQFGENRICDDKKWNNFRSGICFGTFYETRDDYLLFYKGSKISVENQDDEKMSLLLRESFEKNVDRMCLLILKMWKRREAFKK